MEIVKDEATIAAQGKPEKLIPVTLIQPVKPESSACGAHQHRSRSQSRKPRNQPPKTQAQPKPSGDVEHKTAFRGRSPAPRVPTCPYVDLSGRCGKGLVQKEPFCVKHYPFFQAKVETDECKSFVHGLFPCAFMSCKVGVTSLGFVCNGHLPMLRVHATQSTEQKNITHRCTYNFDDSCKNMSDRRNGLCPEHLEEIRTRKQAKLAKVRAEVSQTPREVPKPPATAETLDSKDPVESLLLEVRKLREENAENQRRLEQVVKSTGNVVVTKIASEVRKIPPPPPPVVNVFMVSPEALPKLRSPPPPPAIKMVVVDGVKA